MLRALRARRITRSGSAARECTATPAKRAPVATTDLRPLGLGELLDRAVTLIVRRFSTIATAIAVAYVPFAFVQWALLGRLVPYQARLTREEWSSFSLDLLLGVLVFALSRTAVAAIVGAAYMSRTLSLGAAYVLAARRFGAQIVVNIVAALIGGAILIVAAIPVLVLPLVYTPGSRGDLPIFVVLGIAGAVAVVLGAWLFLAYELATVRLAARAQNGYAAVVAALRATVFRRPWHSLLTAGTLLLVQVGGALIFSGLAQLMPSQPLREFMTFGVGSGITVVIEAFTVTFLVVYDVDIAVRHEGLDLAVALDATPATPA
jgi:hypothetical protein